MIDNIRQYAKFIAAIIGAFVTAFSTLIPAEWSPWLTAAAAFLTAVAVLTIPNQISDAQVRAAAKHLENPVEVAASLVSEENRRTREKSPDQF